MIIYRTYEDSWNPHGFLRSMFWTDGPNAICWTDPNLGSAIDSVIAIQDETARQTAYDHIFTIIHDNAYVAPLINPYKQYAYNIRLRNLTAASTSYEAVEWEKINVAE
jgi:peptide/nickel transport system substrate-binding protein